VQREQNRKKAGLEGEDLSPTTPLSSQGNSIRGEARADTFNIRTSQMRITPEHCIEYVDGNGNVRLTDSGPRIELAQEDDQQAMCAGLMLASQKFGGEVFITGSSAFREMVTREAATMGIKVRNPEFSKTSLNMGGDHDVQL
jgi:hypothetical protein